MQIFVRVADLGSFAAVASQLGLARSVVTRQIAALEEHLGVKLMVRTTRKLTLTSAGASYLDKCRSILDLVESAEADVIAALAPLAHARGEGPRAQRWEQAAQGWRDALLGPACRASDMLYSSAILKKTGLRIRA